MNLLARAGQVAAGLTTKRLPASALREHEITIRLLMAEAYTRGYLDGLEHARDRLTDELDVTRDELDDGPASG